MSECGALWERRRKTKGWRLFENRQKAARDVEHAKGEFGNAGAPEREEGYHAHQGEQRAGGADVTTAGGGKEIASALRRRSQEEKITEEEDKLKVLWFGLNDVKKIRRGSSHGGRGRKKDNSLIQIWEKRELTELDLNVSLVGKGNE